MKISKLIFFDTKKSSFRFFLFFVHTFITNEQFLKTIKSSNFCHFTSTIDKIFTSVDVIIDFFLIFCFDVVMNTVVISTKIVIFENRAVDHNHKVLTKDVILKPFYSFLRHLEPLVVNRTFQMNRKHNIDELLSSENKTRI